YPSRAEEIEIMRRTTSTQSVVLSTLLDADQIIRLQDVVRSVNVGDHVFAYVADLVRATRPQEPGTSRFIRENIGWGDGPRACQYLILGGKARAVLNGRVHVTTDDIKAIAAPVLRHRLVTTFAADAEGITTDRVVAELLATVPIPQDAAASRALGGKRG